MHPAETRPGKLEHGFAGIDAVDIDLRVGAHELAKETTVALTHDQGAFRARDRVDPASPGPLQCVAESDRFEPAIMRCNKIEAHKIFSATNKASGVKRTTSARAVRSSRDTGTKRSAPNKRPLVPRQSATGQAPASNRASTTEPASKRSKSSRAREFACGQHVAIECLP